jgi:hypothetical protein
LRQNDAGIKLGLVGYLFLGCLFVMSTVLAKASKQSAQSSNLGVAFVFSGTGQIGGSTVIFTGGVPSDDFFKALSKTNTSAGARFTIGSNEVKYFPNTFAVILIVSGPVWDKQNRSTVQLDDELMNSLKFEAHWKRGLDMRPVKNLVVGKHPVSQKHGKMTGWAYTLSFEDQNVPLSDHLILDVFLPDKGRIARLSAQL